MSEINLPWLDPNKEDAPFPDPNSALKNPEGLVAAGGDLSPSRILRAYHEGLFPWYEEGQPILWWSPDPRGILYPQEFIAHKSLLRTLKRNTWRVTYDTSFQQVITACAKPRSYSRGTWITDEMIIAYTQLNQLNHAHSIEVWNESNILIGGVYGISLGKIFCGESMFSFVDDASKVALLYLSAYANLWGYTLIDTQLPSDHLTSLGGKEISRKDYLDFLNRHSKDTCHPTAWLEDQPINIDDWLNSIKK